MHFTMRTTVRIQPAFVVRISSSEHNYQDTSYIVVRIRLSERYNQPPRTGLPAPLCGLVHVHVRVLLLLLQRLLRRVQLLQGIRVPSSRILAILTLVTAWGLHEHDCYAAGGLLVQTWCCLMPNRCEPPRFQQVALISDIDGLDCVRARLRRFQ